MKQPFLHPSTPPQKKTLTNKQKTNEHERHNLKCRQCNTKAQLNHQVNFSNIFLKFRSVTARRYKKPRGSFTYS